MIDQSAAVRALQLEAALALYDFGVDVMRQNLRRKFPGAEPERIEEQLAAWIERRPGAELGDANGSVCDRFGAASQ